MSAKQYVQHKSGTGQRFVVDQDFEGAWIVPCRIGGGSHIHLPKSEYALCEPPENWVDISGDCDFRLSHHDGAPRPFQHHPRNIKCNTLFEWPRLAELEGYRLRKVKVFDEQGQNLLNRWAFVVEKREP